MLCTVYHAWWLAIVIVFSVACRITNFSFCFVFFRTSVSKSSSSSRTPTTAHLTTTTTTMTRATTLLRAVGGNSGTQGDLRCVAAEEVDRTRAAVLPVLAAVATRATTTRSSRPTRSNTDRTNTGGNSSGSSKNNSSGGNRAVPSQKQRPLPSRRRQTGAMYVQYSMAKFFLIVSAFFFLGVCGEIHRSFWHIRCCA